MLIGIPKEIKDHEYRIAVTPAGVAVLVSAGHEVRVETRAGEHLGFSDGMYVAAGARIAASPAEVYDCQLVVKVKEPQAGEMPLLKEGQVLFAFLHLAADAALTQALLQKKIVAIAYETVSDAQGALPLLIPMSEVAGRLAMQAGITALQMINGGNGTLISGVPGVPPGKVVVLGAGTVGTEAARMAMGLGADVTILDVNLSRLRHLDEVFGPRLKTGYSEPQRIEELARSADILVGAVYIPGKRAPKLISRDTVKRMQPGSALIDVAIDQGGCAETSRPTTLSAPMYIEEGVVHYCVTNMPAACARTSTQALTHATLPYILRLANKGYRRALLEDAGLVRGLNLHLGQVTQQNVADDLGYDHVPAEQALK